MRKGFLLILIFAFACSLQTEFDRFFDADISVRGGHAPLEVVAFVVAKVDYGCVDVKWRYWYSGFEEDKNEVSEKVCGRRFFTHSFAFYKPGKAFIEVLIDYQGKKLLKRFSLVVMEEGLPPGYSDWDKD